MTRVYLSLGSNIDRENHIKAGLDALAREFGLLTLSPVYESESVGFDGDAFYNLVVAIESELSVGELNAIMKKIEDSNGRSRQGPRFSARTLDIDILLVGDLCGEFDGVSLPRDEIEKNAFVLLPLVDIAAKEKHPLLAISYDDMWKAYKKEQKLWQVAFEWVAS